MRSSSTALPRRRNAMVGAYSQHYHWIMHAPNPLAVARRGVGLSNVSEDPLFLAVSRDI